MKKNKGFLAVLFLCGAMIALAALFLNKRMQGNKEKMNLDKYFNIDGYNANAIPLILDTDLVINKAYDLDGEVYISQEVASELISSKLYWDAHEKKMLFVKPEGILVIQPDKKDYLLNGKIATSTNEIVKTMSDGTIGISLSFMKENVNIESTLCDSPKRLIVKCGWGKKFNMVEVKESDVIRYAADKDSEILVEAKENDILYVLSDNVQSYMRYVKVMNAEGITGYIKNKSIGKPYEEIMKNNYVEPDFKSLHQATKINLGWMQVSNMAANNNLQKLLDRTSGLNVVSPTWFTLADSNGGINSLASKDFVTYAHKKGAKVWALVDDFSQTVKLLDVINKTTTRTTLINNLIKNTLACGADGINVDFEHITKESSPHYIQFLRELLVKCHENNLVLSSDSYVPMTYNEHYKIDEQGKFIDYVIIMAYDEFHAKSEESGSVASIQYTQTAIEKAMAKVIKEKLIIGVPFYTRLWGEQPDTRVVDSVETLGMQEAFDRVKADGGKFTWDEETKQFYTEYIKAGKQYRMWLENNKSIGEKANLIGQSDVAGLGAWRIGYETSDVWPLIKSALKLQ